MRELTSGEQVADACHGDALVVWASRALTGGARVWAHGDAVAAAAPDLSTRDRLAVCGSAEAAESLVRHALRVLGPTFRPIGSATLIDTLVRRIPELTPTSDFGWMQVEDRLPHALDSAGQECPGTFPGAAVRWLREVEWPAAAALLDESFPSSEARPGRAGVRRWAGAHSPDGRLVAVAADAWSAPGVGFIAGVATHPDVRGHGLGARTCGFVLDALLAEYGRAALMVDTWNNPAIELYRRLGMRWRLLRAARVAGSAHLATSG